MKLIKNFLNLLFPPKCLICEALLGHGELYLCLTCENIIGFKKNNGFLEEMLQKRFYGKMRLSKAFVALKYYKGSNVQKLIYEIKYKGQKQAAEWIGYKLGCILKQEEWGTDIPILVPVPLHGSKFSKRGYNQSEEICKGLCKSLDFPLENKSLVRTEARSSQTRKARFQRWLNAEYLYKVENNSNIIGKHIIIVDDVVTTGSTIEACGIELLKAGAREISVICLAISVNPGQ